MKGIVHGVPAPLAGGADQRQKGVTQQKGLAPLGGANPRCFVWRRL